MSNTVGYLDGKYFYPGDKGISYEELPKKNWMIRDSMSGYFLEEIPPFEFPNKMYGNLSQEADYYINSYKNLNSNMAVMLSGVKGTGKTLLAKLIATKSGMPIVNCNMGNPSIVSFIESLPQDIVVVLDEFEKLSGDASTQNAFLTLLQGTAFSRKFFIMTVNENSVSPFLINRPGRVRYIREFYGLTSQQIQEIIEDKLQKPEFKKELENVFIYNSEVNIDMLLAFIDEVNMLNNPDIKTIQKILNVSADSSAHWEGHIYVKALKGEITEAEKGVKQRSVPYTFTNKNINTNKTFLEDLGIKWNNFFRYDVYERFDSHPSSRFFDGDSPMGLATDRTYDTIFVGGIYPEKNVITIEEEPNKVIYHFKPRKSSEPEMVIYLERMIVRRSGY